MTPYTLHHGDCLEVLRTLPDASVDAVVCDPPYGLSFMGKRWDYDVPAVEVWAECLRVLKPGGHLLAFAGTRTQHRMAVRIEDAGFEIRDLIAWVYGSGFPKSLDVSKAIDREAGAERKKVTASGGLHSNRNLNDDGWSKIGEEQPSMDGPIPATPEAQQWTGWGTALKPALEPITVARKPLDGTVAENVLAHGTGALNVDGCRVEAGDGYTENAVTQGINTARTSYDPRQARRTFEPSASGRWPANLIHDGSEEVVGLFPQTESGKPCGKRGPDRYGFTSHEGSELTGYGDSGSAARFFYCAKAAKADRDAGCEAFQLAPLRFGDDGGTYQGLSNSKHLVRNHHPTVKPTDLMRYLCRLVTQPGGVVLDPFMGSGSTGRGAILEGFRFVGIEREADYLAIARARIDDAVAMRAGDTAQLTML